MDLESINMVFDDTQKMVCLVPWQNLQPFPVSQHPLKKSAYTVMLSAPTLVSMWIQRCHQRLSTWLHLAISKYVTMLLCPDNVAVLRVLGISVDRPRCFRIRILAFHVVLM